MPRTTPILVLALAGLAGCGGSRGRGVVLVEKPSLAPIPESPEPDWVAHLEVAGNEICGVGIAGRTFHTQWERAKALATERANRNLAGALESSVIEAQIVNQTDSGASIEYELAVEVDPEAIARVAATARTDLWYDVKGEGPAGEVGFTYARSCLPASLAANELKIAGGKLKRLPSGVNEPGTPPEWLTWVGSQRGAKLCAVGYSDPGFAPESVVEGVVDEVRGQLVSAARSVVMSAFEEESTCKGSGSACQTTVSELMAAATDAVSRGVVVTHFWFDRQGIGPRKRKRSVYGWGCVYPVVAVRIPAPPPEAQTTLDPATVEKVKERAAKMFEELDQEEFKRRAQD